jgi:hypothetical protein
MDVNMISAEGGALAMQRRGNHGLEGLRHSGNKTRKQTIITLPSVVMMFMNDQEQHH